MLSRRISDPNMDTLPVIFFLALYCDWYSWTSNYKRTPGIGKIDLTVNNFDNKLICVDSIWSLFFLNIAATLNFGTINHLI